MQIHKKSFFGQEGGIIITYGRGGCVTPPRVVGWDDTLYNPGVAECFTKGSDHLRWKAGKYHRMGGAPQGYHYYNTKNQLP